MSAAKFEREGHIIVIGPCKEIFFKIDLYGQGARKRSNGHLQEPTTSFSNVLCLPAFRSFCAWDQVLVSTLSAVGCKSFLPLCQVCFCTLRADSTKLSAAAPLCDTEVLSDLVYLAACALSKKNLLFHLPLCNTGLTSALGSLTPLRIRIRSTWQVLLTTGATLAFFQSLLKLLICRFACATGGGCQAPLRDHKRTPLQHLLALRACFGGFTRPRKATIQCSINENLDIFLATIWIHLIWPTLFPTEPLTDQGSAYANSSLEGCQTVEWKD